MARDNRTKEIEQILLAREIEDFLYAEADLLDAWRYDEWLNLLTDDVHYWMPLRRNIKFGDWDREMTKELQDLAWFDEGKTTLAQRVNQLMTGIHWAEEPLSRISHIVSNIRITKAVPSFSDPAEVTIRCRFFVYRNRLQEETDFFVGKREDVLRKVEGQWKIARRSLFLDQNVLLAKNMTFLF